MDRRPRSVKMGPAQRRSFSGVTPNIGIRYLKSLAFLRRTRLLRLLRKRSRHFCDGEGERRYENGMATRSSATDVKTLKSRSRVTSVA